jgi:DNA mismatch repair ATPase MutL
MPVPIEHLNGLWRELKNIAVIEEEGTWLSVTHLFTSLPVRRSWISGSGSKTATARSWLPGCCTADPAHWPF